MVPSDHAIKSRKAFNFGSNVTESPKKGMDSSCMPVEDEICNQARQNSDDQPGNPSQIFTDPLHTFFLQSHPGSQSWLSALVPEIEIPFVPFKLPVNAFFPVITPVFFGHFYLHLCLAPLTDQQ